jgi:hypothetical protein
MADPISDDGKDEGRDDDDPPPAFEDGSVVFQT